MIWGYPYFLETSILFNNQFDLPGLCSCTAIVFFFTTIASPALLHPQCHQIVHVIPGIFSVSFVQRKTGPPKKLSSPWWFKVTFLGWLSDPFKGLSGLQLGMKRALWITWPKFFRFAYVPSLERVTQKYVSKWWFFMVIYRNCRNP